METVFEKVAAENHTTPEEVRSEIAAAIQMAMEQSDPAAQEKWRTMSPVHQTPTPEDAIIGILEILFRNGDISP